MHLSKLLLFSCFPDHLLPHIDPWTCCKSPSSVHKIVRSLPECNWNPYSSGVHCSYPSSLSFHSKSSRHLCPPPKPFQPKGLTLQLCCSILHISNYGEEQYFSRPGYRHDRWCSLANCWSDVVLVATTILPNEHYVQLQCSTGASVQWALEEATYRRRP
jgi:hypothetical protein